MLLSQRDLFEIPRDVCYLNSASYSPLPLKTLRAGRDAVGRKGQPWTLDAGFAGRQHDRARGLGGGTGAKLVKTGYGTMTLSGINTYTGATTVNGGTLEIQGSIALGTVTSNATLAYIGTATAGSTSRLFGVAAGADYFFSPSTVAGFALAGGGTSFGVKGFGSGRSDLFQAGAFIKHNVGQAYITGALAYAWQDVTTDRTVTIAGIDRLRAQFNANAFSGRAEAGYRFVSPWIAGVGITPYAAGQFTTFDLPAYAEQVVSGANTFALAYGSKSLTATRSELGLRADKSFAMTNAILTLRGRAAWARDFNPDRAVAATFQTLPGASFVVNGARQASDAALTTASAEVKWMNGWSATGTFEGEFSNVTRSYAGKGAVRYSW